MAARVDDAVIMVNIFPAIAECDVRVVSIDSRWIMK